jgi:NAD(P)-dependent dehydrogenase (short-subunit alcohol dehydrogenase family)
MTTSSSSVAIVTGAGSGIGRAVALRLVGEGWRVALVGRRPEALAETAALINGEATTYPCDVADAGAVNLMTTDVLAKAGRIDALIHCAGTNIAKRSWEQLSGEDYRRVMAANLDGAFNCVHAVVPAMRQQGGGTVVVINSDAGRQANAKAGAAYVVSKFGLTGLVQSLNAEERGRGIRACSIFPGDVNTPLLDRRPQPPPAEARLKMLQPEDVAAAVWLALSLPPRAIIEELVIRPA